jgi:predicted ATP-grasp superfamily ATP-dependent carboligase
MPVVWRPDSGAALPNPGAMVLSCFPSAGLAPTVAGHYILQALKLPRIGNLLSDELPPLAVIQGGRVNPPVRAYGNTELVLVLSEFPVLPTVVGPLATAILDVAMRLKAARIVGLEGVVPQPTEVEDDASSPVPPPSDEKVWYAGSGAPSQLPAEFKAVGVRAMDSGVIGGVSGALLVAGMTASIPVGSLLVSATDAGYPDHRAAAKIIEVIDQALPHFNIDTKPLRAQAEMIERALRAAMKSREGSPANPPAADTLPIYQ